MDKNNPLQILLRQFKSITIEPALFVYTFGLGIVLGAQITTNLLIWKICHLELNYPEEICGNLSIEANQKIEGLVQAEVNNFLMKSNWIASVPIIFFSVIAGALSDEFGRKPLLLLPMLGNFFAMMMNTINYTFITSLPLEFFYLEQISAFFGGYAVYYLGMYSFVTNVTKEKERAHRLARLDGMEILGYVAGTLSSPVIFKKLGYYGNYSISAGMIALSLIYLLTFVKEPVSKQHESIMSKGKYSLKKWCYLAVATPLLGMKSLIFKKRKLTLKLLILLQFAAFFIYWLIIEVNLLKYLYMLFVFEGFNETDYSYFSVFNDLSSAFSLMFIMPFLNAKLRIHDALMLVIVVGAEVTCYTALPFASLLWQFYFASGVGSLGYCKYAVVRSLISKCISIDEVGKVFSILAVVAALAPVAGNPMFRQLYNATLETFPGAIFLLAASLLFVAPAGNFFIYIKRHELENAEDSEEKSIRTISETLEMTNL
jgi:PCFT/HCP family folate transporter-like MFS transporter 1/3